MEERHEQRVRRDDPDSLAPLQIERLSVEDEAALMSRGKTSQLITMIGVGALCAVAAVITLGGMQSRDRRTDAITAIRELHQIQGEGFLRCALPGVPGTQLATREELHTALEHSSERYGKSYANTLQRCGIKLHALDDGLTRLEAPADVADQLSALRGAGKHLREVVAAYTAYLADDHVAYDYVQALPRIEKIAVAFSVYEKRREQLESSLRDAL